MITTIYGWTLAQWAYAKQRHRLHVNDDVAADGQGMLVLRAWWHSHNWPEPLCLRLDGVKLEGDDEWAARAMTAAMTSFYRLSASGGIEGGAERGK